jgi:hypothetical protein
VFFSRKLSKMQQKCSFTEIELLSIAEILKEFKKDAVGARHKSLHRSQKSHKRCPRTHL